MKGGTPWSVGGGVPPCSLNPDPISDKKMPFPIRFQTIP